MSIVGRIQEYLSTGAKTLRDRTREPSRGRPRGDSPERQGSPPEDRPAGVAVEPSSRLYRCESCDVTYVSETMDDCSRCGAAVETTPSEHDLGLV